MMRELIQAICFPCLLITNVCAYTMESKDPHPEELVKTTKKRSIENVACILCNPSICDFEDEAALARHQQKVHQVRVDYKVLKRRKKLGDLYCKLCEKTAPGCKYGSD
jgi:hypothetical protein